MINQSKIEIWEINKDICNDIIPLLQDRTHDTTYLLNTNNECMNILEKIVYEIAILHFKRLNIIYDTEKYFIEFWWKNKLSINNKLHIDCDEYERKYNNTIYYPLCSTVTYFNDNDFPTLITNVNYEDYTYKKNPCEKEIIISIPNSGKHIVFDSKYYHGECNITGTSNFNANRYILAVNLWNRKPSYIPYYDNLNYVNYFLKNISKNIDEYFKYNINSNVIDFIQCNENIKTIELESNLLDKNMYDILLYDNTQNIFNNTFPKLNNIIKDVSNDTVYITYKNETSNYKIVEDIKNLLNDNILYESVFNKIEIFDNIYSVEICNWIIYESEKYAK